MNEREGAYDFLWVPATLLFGVGDIITTRLALNLGGIESNSIVRFFIDDLEWGFWAFAMLKIAILISLLFISFSALGRFRWVMPGFLSCVAAYLMMHNIAIILALT